MRYLHINKVLVGKVFGAALVASVALGMASCVAEESFECPPDVRLLIKTDQDTGRWGTDTRVTDEINWYNSIMNMNVYVFDESEKFVTFWVGGEYTPGEDYEVPLSELNLPEGIYTFVVWTNRGEEHGYTCNVHELLATQPEESGTSGESGNSGSDAADSDFYLDDMLMRMSIPENGDALEEDLAHRHYGIKTVYVSNNSILDPRENTIEISPSIHRVKFSVTGLGPEVVGDDYSLTITDNNSVHDFRNRYVWGQDSYRHTRTLSRPEPEEPGTRADGSTPLVASMHLMQLNDGTTTTFEVRNSSSGNPVLKGDLVKIIRDAHNGMSVGENTRPLDFDRTLEFDVELTFITRAEINVVVNGWTYIWTPTIIGW